MTVLRTMSSGRAIKGGNVTAVLGPTNTGKTHLAIERMLAHRTGAIGLPLRLLAREVYTRLVERAGVDAVALYTGEEKIVPPGARYQVCTVEAMPFETNVEFVAIDEIQLASDFTRGHIFTDRLLNLRGTSETLLLGASTMRPLIEHLLPHANVITRPRMSQLVYNGSKKITRLPRRSAIIAFSAHDVYAIAELVRRQRGGTAVVLGSLSPRTRNAQVEMFQNGDVEFLIATDAIGMGLNLDVDHVAFAASHKYDGHQYRPLTPAELGQIAGRAGRHLRDGTFGVTSRVEPFDNEMVDRLENHAFTPHKIIQWRNRNLDFSTGKALRNSLDVLPTKQGLIRAPLAQDVLSLEHSMRDSDCAALINSEKRVRTLWDACSIPDYRKIAPANHSELVMSIFTHLARQGSIPDDWIDKQVKFADRTDGDIDTLSNRIAHIRTWTFVANRKGWLDDHLHWQERTRAVEDRLSDALHKRLTQRFVDRRTSVLMKKLRENVMLEAEITATGDVLVEEQHVGQLHGFRFVADASAEGSDAKALKTAAQKALANEIQNRAERLNQSSNDDFILSGDGSLRWHGDPIARLVDSDSILQPRFVILADEHLSGPSREQVQSRINLWLDTRIETLLDPLLKLKNAESLDGLARGIAYQLVEALGILERQAVSDEIRSLDQDARAMLRRLGVRFGAHHIFIPALLKPAPSGFLAILWALKNGGLDQKGVTELASLSASGRTSIPAENEIHCDLYKAVGFRVLGGRAVRIDILERLADQIRPLLSWRPKAGIEDKPEGALDGRSFSVTVTMTSLLGCAGDDFSTILKSLGYRVERRKIEMPASEPEIVLEEIVPVEHLPAENNDTEPQAKSESAISTENEETAEEQWLEIWRPGKPSDRAKKHFPKKSAKDQKQNSRQEQKEYGNRSKSTKKPSNHKKAPRQDNKPINPNSPFAALAALKKEMGK